MTPAQKRLTELRARQSRERQRMAELGIADCADRLRPAPSSIRNRDRDAGPGAPASRRANRRRNRRKPSSAPPATVARDRKTTPKRASSSSFAAASALGGYVAAAVEQRSATGAELEYNAARGIAGNRFPLELLAPPETRATTDADTQTMPRRWLDRLFAGTAAEAVGVTMESVPAGVASFPVTTGGASAAQRQRSTDAAADAAWTIGVSELRSRPATRSGCFSASRTRPAFRVSKARSPATCAWR